MVSSSPADAFGSQARDVGPLLVETIRSVHERFAEAHQVSGSRYAMGYGSLWRDLLDHVQEALTKAGHRTHKLRPAGYKLSVVNNSLVYVWRIPDSVSTASSFPTSPTRLNCFSARSLDPLLFEPGFTGESDAELVVGSPVETELEDVVRAAEDIMPLVLIMVRSSPRELQSIEWAVAKLDAETGKVSLHGAESIWQPELRGDEAATPVAPFDSGTVNGPTVKPQEQEGTEPDAR